MTKSRQKLYDSVSQYLDIGDFDTFNTKMNDADSRKRFHDAVSQYVEMPSFDEFESKISRQKDATPEEINTGIQEIIDSPDAPASEFPSYEQKAYGDSFSQLEPVPAFAESTGQSTSVDRILNSRLADERTIKEKAQERVDIVKEDNLSQLDRLNAYQEQLKSVGDDLGIPSFETVNEEIGLWNEALNQALVFIARGEKPEKTMKPMTDYFNRFRDDNEDEISGKEILASIGRGASNLMLLPPELAKEAIRDPAGFALETINFFAIHAPLMMNKLLTASGLNPINTGRIALGDESAIQEKEDAQREIAEYPIETLITAIGFKQGIKSSLKPSNIVRGAKLQYDLALKSVKDSNWYRSLTIKEKGLVPQTMEQVIKMNPKMSEAQIARMFPQKFKESLDKRKVGEPVRETRQTTKPIDVVSDDVIIPEEPIASRGFVEVKGEVPKQFNEIHEINKNNPNTDNLSIEFTDESRIISGTLEELSELTNFKYSPDYFKEVLDLDLIKKGEDGYVEGQETYRAEVFAEHTTNREGGSAKVSSRGTRADYIEDAVIEHIYGRLREENPELLRKIEDWTKAVEREALEEGIEYFPRDIELFSKTYLFQRLGYASENPIVAETFRLPQEIIDEFDALVGATRDGEVDVTPYMGDEQPSVIRVTPKKTKPQKENAPPLQIGDEVQVTYRNTDYTATVNSDPINNNVSVKIKNVKANGQLAGQFIDVPVRQATKIVKNVGLKKFQDDLKQLPKKQRTKARKDAREFDDLLFENDELLLGDRFEEFQFRNPQNMTKTGTKAYIESLRDEVADILDLEGDIQLPVARYRNLKKLKQAIKNPDSFETALDDDLASILGVDKQYTKQEVAQSVKQNLEKSFKRSYNEKIVDGHNGMLLREVGWGSGDGGTGVLQYGLDDLQSYVANKLVRKAMRENDTYKQALRQISKIDIFKEPLPKLPKITQKDITDMMAESDKKIGEKIFIEEDSFGSPVLMGKYDVTKKEIALFEEMKKQGLWELDENEIVQVRRLTPKGNKLYQKHKTKGASSYSIKKPYETFYSKARDVAEKLGDKYPQKSLKARSVKNWFKNQGVRKEEMEFLEIDDLLGRYLPNESVSATEIKEWLRMHEVDIQVNTRYEADGEVKKEYVLAMNDEPIDTFASEYDAQLAMNEVITNDTYEIIDNLEVDGYSDFGDIELIEFRDGWAVFTGTGAKLEFPFKVEEDLKIMQSHLDIQVVDKNSSEYQNVIETMDEIIQKEVYPTKEEAIGAFESDYYEYAKRNIWEVLEREVEDLDGEFAPGVQYQQWTLPGGNNYKETNLLWTGEEINQPHFEDLPETIAHMRTKDRIADDGSKVFFVEEMQSDWHKAGFEKGYKSDLKEITLKDAGNELQLMKLYGFDKKVMNSVFVPDNLPKQIQKSFHTGFPYISRVENAYSRTQPAVYEVWTDPVGNPRYIERTLDIAKNALEKHIRKNLVPDAPFKDFRYLNTLLKQALREAVDGQYDAIAFPKGNDVADIYGVIKYISKIEFQYPRGDSDLYTINAFNSNGSEVTRRTSYTKEDIIDTFGKAIWNKIDSRQGVVMDSNPQSTRNRFMLRDLDLMIGGEMHRKIYDVEIPARLNKLVKKYGGRLSSKKMDDINATSLDLNLKMREVFAEPQPTFSIRKPHKFKNDEIEKRFSEAEKGIQKESFIKESGEAVGRFFKGFVRKYIDLPRSSQYARAYNTLRNYQAQQDASDEKAVRLIDSMVKDLSKPEFKVFQRAVIMQDLKKDLERDKPIPFGLDKDNFMEEFDALDEIITPKIYKKLEQRTNVIQTTLKQLVDAGILDRKLLDDDPNYFHHQVLLYNNMRKDASNLTTLTKPKPSYGKERKGTELDINANYLQAEFAYLSQAHKDLATKKAIEQIKADYDISATLTDKNLIPEGYSTWQPDKGNVFFTGNTITEKALNDVLMELDFGQAGDAKDLLLEKMRSNIMMGGKKQQFILPDPLVQTLDKLRPDIEKNVISSRFLVPITQAWKKWVLMNPRRVVKYNLNNLSGDLDALIAGNPGALKKVPEAVGTMYNAFMYRGELPQSYFDALDRGVFDAGFSTNEITQVNEMERFFRLLDKKPNALNRGWKFYWRGMRKATTLRENVFRYANYLHVHDKLKSGKTLEDIGLYATSPKMVEGVTDKRDLAGILTRDLIGDYGNVSANGQFVRDNLFPFWSWVEVQMKRYPNLIANSFRSKRFGSLARMGLLYGLVHLYNKTQHPEEYKEMSTLDKTRLNVIIGRSENGDIQSLRFQGSTSDFLDWFGFTDAVTELDLIERGQATYKDLASEVAKAPARKIINGLTPVMKIPFELMANKSFYPDPFEARPIDDKYRHLLKNYSLENEYDWLMGRPNKGYLNSIKKSVIYERNIPEMNYWSIKDLTNRFLKNKGVEMDGYLTTTKSRVMREYKKALRYNDDKALAKAKEKMKTLKIDQKYIKDNLKRLNPLGSLSNDDKLEFYQSLNKKDLEKFDSAMKYYTDVLNPDANYADEMGYVKWQMSKAKMESGNVTRKDVEEFRRLVRDLYKKGIITKSSRTTSYGIARKALRGIDK